MPFTISSSTSSVSLACPVWEGTKAPFSKSARTQVDSGVHNKSGCHSWGLGLVILGGQTTSLDIFLFGVVCLRPVSVSCARCAVDYGSMGEGMARGVLT